VSIVFGLIIFCLIPSAINLLVAASLIGAGVLALVGRNDYKAWQQARERRRNYTYKQAIRDLESIMLIASDGSTKSLMHFSLADVSMWATRAEEQGIAWQERKQWFIAAEQQLQQAGVELVRDLPVPTVQALAHQARLVWKES
jgi:hypothetical protein